MYPLTLTDMKEVAASYYGSDVANFLGVAIQLPDAPKPEIIINPKENFAAKIGYYASAYNEDLTHKAAGSGIKIVGYTFAQTIDELYKDLSHLV